MGCTAWSARGAAGGRAPRPTSAAAAVVHDIKIPKIASSMFLDEQLAGDWKSVYADAPEQFPQSKTHPENAPALSPSLRSRTKSQKERAMNRKLPAKTRLTDCPNNNLCP